jgi:hypothetical protein
VLLLTLIAAWPCQAAPRSGIVGATVNLRTGPGVDTRVITKIEAGETVRIEAEQGEWLQVALDGESFGYRGWIASRFIQPAPTEPKPSGGEPARPAAPEPPPAKTTAAAMSETPPPAPAAPAGSGTFPTAADPEKSMAAALTAPPPPPDSLASPPVQAAKELPPPAVRLWGDRRMPPQASSAASGGPGALLQLALRLATVLLSCLALIVALRAYRLAQAAWERTERPVER